MHPRSKLHRALQWSLASLAVLIIAWIASAFWMRKAVQKAIIPTWPNTLQREETIQGSFPPVRVISLEVKYERSAAHLLQQYSVILENQGWNLITMGWPVAEDDSPATGDREYAHSIWENLWWSGRLTVLVTPTSGSARRASVTLNVWPGRYLPIPQYRLILSEGIWEIAPWTPEESSASDHD